MEADHAHPVHGCPSPALVNPRAPRRESPPPSTAKRGNEDLGTSYLQEGSVALGASSAPGSRARVGQAASGPSRSRSPSALRRWSTWRPWRAHVVSPASRRIFTVCRLIISRIDRTPVAEAHVGVDVGEQRVRSPGDQLPRAVGGVGLEHEAHIRPPARSCCCWPAPAAWRSAPSTSPRRSRRRHCVLAGGSRRGKRAGRYHHGGRPGDRRGRQVDPARRAEVLGMLLSGSIAGMLLARAFAGMLGGWLGWRAPYLLDAGVCLRSRRSSWRSCPRTRPDRQDPARAGCSARGRRRGELASRRERTVLVVSFTSHNSIRQSITAAPGRVPACAGEHERDAGNALSRQGSFKGPVLRTLPVV